eukprot:s2135_g3.t2
MIHTANVAIKVIMHVSLRAQNKGSMPFSPRFHFFRWRSKILLTKTARMLPYFQTRRDRINGRAVEAAVARGGFSLFNNQINSLDFFSWGSVQESTVNLGSPQPCYMSVCTERAWPISCTGNLDGRSALDSSFPCGPSKLDAAQSQAPKWAWSSLSPSPPDAGFSDGSVAWEEILDAQQRVPTQESIRVAARFRPLSLLERETGEDETLCVKFGRDGQSCTLRMQKTHGICDFPFAYDHLFQPEASQYDVYRAVAQPIVEGVIHGYNGAILAYGQTGSGKTHTMFGPFATQAFVDSCDFDSHSLGIIPRALQELVDYAENTDGLVQLRASYVEIYNENVLDLLSPLGGVTSGDMPSTAVMREQAKDLFLPTVTETPFNSVREAMEVMRHQAETKMNRHSSRSHAVFIVTVVNRVDQSRQKFGQLYLVDLAGSERVIKTAVAGTHLVEAKNINKSLLALGQVIFALAHKQKHVPYRDSKLTQLLRNCLGGNARTAVLITVSPHRDNAGESLSSLRFGARASLVENAATENVAENVHELKRLLEHARQDLAELRASNRRLQAELSVRSAPLGGHDGPPSQKCLAVWELLPSLVCPLTRGIMREPVLASDGWSHERRALEKHIARAGRIMPVSPVTGQRLSTRLFTPNLLVRQLVRQYLPDLGPLEEPLPVIQRLHIWHVQLILSFLDFRSLARCEAAWPSFRAMAEDKVWGQLLQRDYPDCDVELLAARSTYREEAVKAAAHKPAAGGPKDKADGARRGLRTFQPGSSL